MKLIRALVVALGAGTVVLAGCQSIATPRGEEAKAQPSRVLAYQDRKPERTATLVVVRDGGFMAFGNPCFHSFWINGTLAARLEPSETATFFLEPGEYVLRAGRDPEGAGLCAVNQGNYKDRETILRANETKRFRLSVDQGGVPDVQRAE